MPHKELIANVKYIRFSFRNDEIQSVGVKDTRTQFFIWKPAVVEGIKHDVEALQNDVEALQNDAEALHGKDLSIESEIGEIAARVDNEIISFDVVSGTSIPVRQYYLFCDVKQGKDYNLRASGPFTELACYGITKEDVGVNLGSFLTSRTLSFTADLNTRKQPYQSITGLIPAMRR